MHDRAEVFGGEELITALYAPDSPDSPTETRQLSCAVPFLSSELGSELLKLVFKLFLQTRQLFILVQVQIQNSNPGPLDQR